MGRRKMMKEKDNITEKKHRYRKWIVGIVSFFCLAAGILFFMDWKVEDSGFWTPDYQKIDLSEVLNRETLSESDYHTILMQTGLGKMAVDELLEKATRADRLRIFEEYQDHFFSPGIHDCRRAAIIVHEERLRDEEGEPAAGFDIASLRNGDILITKSTHSLGWRHGHAAIVTNAEKGETLEAILLGNPSLLEHVSKWQTFPSFIQLRLKGGAAEAEMIAKYARTEGLGIPYALLTGIPVKAPEKIDRTQCAHLVWYPYEHFGYDIDSDGSWLVTPKDIAKSDLLEVVQVYGADPEDIWP